MSVLVDCPKCGAIIGEVSGLDTRSARGHEDFPPDDSAVCNHPKFKKTETLQLFGLIKEIHIDYPETDTASSWVEYLGPSNKFMLFIAIIFSGYTGIIVNGKWAWWDSRIGLFGNGIDELANLKPKVA